MLTQRTNILFDQQSWLQLKQIARNQKTSIGQLVRDAVQKTYIESQIQKNRAKAIEETIRIRPHFKGKIDYKALINYGHKY